MRLTLTKALALALLANLLPGCERIASDREEAASKGSTAAGATSGQTPYGGAIGQAGEGSTDERSAPERPSSK
jgi:hypothetical protein